MPRRAAPMKRRIPADPVHGSVLVQQLINKMMLDGKKSTAEKIVYDALSFVEERTGTGQLFMDFAMGITGHTAGGTGCGSTPRYVFAFSKNGVSTLAGFTSVTEMGTPASASSSIARSRIPSGVARSG